MRVARFLGALAVVLATTVSVMGAAAGATARATEVRVALVIDFGARHGAHDRVVARCLKVPAGDNGTDVLLAATQQLHLAAPAYAPDGLLCAINGYPSNGCGAAAGGGYAYWSYWHGGAKWSYATLGPAEVTVTNDDVEGWRFQPDSAGTSSDPPPRTSPHYGAICRDAAASGETVVPANSDDGVPWVTVAVGALVAVALVATTRRWRRERA